RVLALLPGFTVNRRFMEQMMGVRESLPESIITELQSASWQERLQDSWRLVKTVVGLVTNYFLLPRRIRQFYRRLDRALQASPFNIEDLRPDELAAYYRQIESQLLTRWDAPLINDFLAMIFYGVLRRLTEKWCNDESKTLQNDLIGGEGNIISTEPAKKMREMADLVTVNREFAKLLCDGSLTAILPAMAQLPQFKLLYQQYLDKFGDRCLEELKLESPTLQDNPLPLLRAIGQLSLSPSPSLPVSPSSRKTAELRVRRALRGNPLRRFVFNWVLKNARRRVRDRENLRFERTRVFGRARRVFVELGKRFYALDLLNSPRDIFYLEVNEILGFIEGTATCTDLKGLVAVRQAEFAKYKDMPSPGDRFETRGIVYRGIENGLVSSDSVGCVSETQSSVTHHSYLQGIGCSPGVVRGAVRVIKDPKQIVGNENSVPLQPGTIIVADRTDPGWILLFPAAAGLLVEKGSLLSHAAIVARELGIPAIVSLPGVTEWLKDGDLVELNGSTGKVSKIS
ncbi:phosphoenolpyruvate synthase, partial [Planktothrix sp. FACHB-1355]